MLRIDNSPSFGAKLDLTKVKGHKKRWYRVANEFEKMTNGKRENYVLQLSSRQSSGSERFNKDIFIEGISPVSKELTTIAELKGDYVEKLMQLSPKRIAKKIKVLYDISGYNEYIFDRTRKLYQALFDIKKGPDEYFKDDITEKLQVEINSAQDANIKAWLVKDSDLLSESNVKIGSL